VISWTFHRIRWSDPLWKGKITPMGTRHQTASPHSLVERLDVCYVTRACYGANKSVDFRIIPVTQCWS